MKSYEIVEYFHSINFIMWNWFMDLNKNNAIGF